MKKILLLTTGGTIACIETDEGLEPGVTGKGLLDRIPEINSLCEVTIKQILNIDSSNMSASEWTIIADAIYDGLNEYDGIVITHGTDTMAYTTSIISYMLRNVKKPVVFTGSQKPITNIENDAITNLYQAFLVAISKVSGICLVFNGKIIKGTRAFKIHSLNEDAFVSCNDSYIGKIEGGQVFINQEDNDAHLQMEYYPKVCDDVFLLKLIPGIKTSIIEYIIENQYKGVVVEAFGLGGIPSEYNNLLEEFQKMTSVYKIPVVVVTQCIYDGTDLNIYSVGKKAESAGLISARDMTTEATVTKLMWALGQTDDYETINEIIQSNLCGELNENYK